MVTSFAVSEVLLKDFLKLDVTIIIKKGVQKFHCSEIEHNLLTMSLIQVFAVTCI
jgi:hypothetical protein